MKKYTITQQDNLKFSIFTFSGFDVSMADETLIKWDFEEFEEAITYITDILKGEYESLQDEV